MSLICQIIGCHQESDVCRCRRCGRPMHGWRQIEKKEIRVELIGLTRKGRMKYDKTFQIKHRCACCGQDRLERFSEIVDH